MPQPRITVLFMLGLALSAGAAGCTVRYKPLKAETALAGATVPVPRQKTTTEFGPRTVQLQYALPGRAVAPTLISFQQISIVDDAGLPCPVVSTNWGKSAEFWAGISFMAPAQAKKITASFTLSLDNVDYPLTAILTRIDPTHWRVDYGITPGD